MGKKNGKMKLSSMSNDELHALRVDLGRIANAKRQEINDIQQTVARITATLQKRDTDGNVEIAPHAVLRYLERVKGLDINGVREEMLDRVRNGNGEVEVKGTAVGVLSGEFVFVLQKKPRASIVVTVFEAREYQSAKAWRDLDPTPTQQEE